MKKKYMLMLLVISPACFAEDLGPVRTTETVNVAKPDNVEVAAGYLLNDSKSSDGSSTSKQNLTGNFLFQRMDGKWGQEFHAEAVNTQDDSATDNIERYLAYAKQSYHFTDTAYQFAKLQWEKDLSSSFDYQASLTAGLGYDILKDDVQSLTGEIGAGYRYSKDREAPYDAHNEAIGTLALFYKRALTSNINFQQDLGYEFGSESQVLRSRTALDMAVNKHFAVQASYQIKQTNADLGNSRDSLLALGLKYQN